jgi:peroxiredoxin
VYGQPHEPIGSPRARAVSPLLLVCGLLAASLSLGPARSAAAEAAAVAAPVPSAAAARPDRAADFVLRSASGPNVRLSELVGDVVVLSFWSSRCNVCRQQLAGLEQAYGTYRPAGFHVLGISVDDDVAAARTFATAQGVSFPMLLDPAKVVARAYRVDDLPMMVAIDRFGAVRFVLRGTRDDLARDYVQDLRKLIDE